MRRIAPRLPAKGCPLCGRQTIVRLDWHLRVRHQLDPELPAFRNILSLAAEEQPAAERRAPVVEESSDDEIVPTQPAPFNHQDLISGSSPAGPSPRQDPLSGRSAAGPGPRQRQFSGPGPPPSSPAVSLHQDEPLPCGQACPSQATVESIEVSGESDPDGQTSQSGSWSERSSSSDTESDPELPAALKDVALEEGASTLLAAYFNHTIGAFPTLRRRSNAASSLKRIVEFLVLLHSPGSVTARLEGLRNHTRCGEWIDLVRGRDLTPTTVKNYCLDVAAFLRYLKDYRPVRVRKRYLRRLRLKIIKILRDQRRVVRTHKDAVYRTTRDQLLSPAQLRELLEKVRAEIGELFNDFELLPTHRVANRLGALIIVYLTALNGCRRGTWINLSRQDLLEATVKDGLYLVSVANHKTAHLHGEAVLVLKPEEHRWLTAFAQLSSGLPGFR